MSYSPLAPQFTEDAIKDVLDGTFTRVNYEGKITTVEVDDDHTPTRTTNNCGRPPGMKMGDKQVFWTPEEEEILIVQRRLGRPFAEIAWLLSRSLEATKKHYKILRVRGVA